MPLARSSTDSNVRVEEKEPEKGEPEKREPEEKEATLSKDQKASQDGSQAPRPKPVLQSLLWLSLSLCMFLVALDMNIIATAIPTITEQFHSTDEVGWYGSAFFMTLAAFQAFWGKGYKMFSLKVVFPTSVLFFEVGSLVIALAPNSVAFIAGRAVQGMGGAGITGGIYTISAHAFDPKRVPAVTGSFGLIWSCASVIGPLLGGVFTQYVTWRWCFWINLPIGGATIAIILLFFRALPQSNQAPDSWKAAASAFDFPGMVLLLGALICFNTATQEGGLLRPWDSSIPIGLLVGFGLMLIIFVVVEFWQGENAMLVVRVLRRRNIAVCACYSFFANAAQFARTYNMPIYFQASQGASPSESGIRILPTVISIVVSVLLSSVLVGKVGMYPLFLLFGGVLTTVGSAMIYTLDIESPSSKWIGYQVIAGIGMGSAIQIPLIVAQTTSSRQDLAVAIGAVLFAQCFGGAIGVATAQCIQNNVLTNRLPSALAQQVLEAGATGLRNAFPDPVVLQQVLNAYMAGLKGAWLFSVGTAGMSLFCAFAGRSGKIQNENDETM